MTKHYFKEVGGTYGLASIVRRPLYDLDILPDDWIMKVHKGGHYLDGISRIWVCNPLVPENHSDYKLTFVFVEESKGDERWYFLSLGSPSQELLAEEADNLLTDLMIEELPSDRAAVEELIQGYTEQNSGMLEQERRRMCH